MKTIRFRHPWLQRIAALLREMQIQATKQLTTAPGRFGRAKNKYIIDCFARPLPNAVRKMATVGSCPARPAAVRHSPICHRVLSARLRPVLRRDASRCHFARRACGPVRPHFGLARTVGCNSALPRQKKSPPSMAAQRQ